MLISDPPTPHPRNLTFLVSPWVAANGCNNGGLSLFRPFSAPSRPFPEGLKSTWEIQKTQERGLFPLISSDLLKPPSLKPPFAAPQSPAPQQTVQNMDLVDFGNGVGAPKPIFLKLKGPFVRLKERFPWKAWTRRNPNFVRTECL